MEKQDGRIAELERKLTSVQEDIVQLNEKCNETFSDTTTPTLTYSSSSLLSSRATQPPSCRTSIIIYKSKLCGVNEVLQKFPKERNICSAGRLCCKLLPKSELEALKKAMLDIFPVYKNSRVEFEAVWEKYIVALQQCCKKLRTNEHYFVIIQFMNK